MACARCQGNGEIVLDWDRYLSPRCGDKGDEAVASCPDCDGTGEDMRAVSETVQNARRTE
jgi:DnaJ-class molecular chaperone